MKTLIDEMIQIPSAELPSSPRDFKPDVDVRWCAGCGAISVLTSTQRLLPDLGLPKEKIVFVSGIGCSGRFPYYVDTYGFHTIHGRAIPVATGLKLSRPDLSVWVITGDGDNMSIGGNHFIHGCRRNVNLNVLMFNNEVYSLTKGQYSPTSKRGQVTKSSPRGVLEDPFNPVALALGAGAGFVARAHDKDRQAMQRVLGAAHAYPGFSFVEIYTNCRIFNDGAFDRYTSPDTRDDSTIWLEHDKPLVFGKAKDKGIRLDGYTPRVVSLTSGEWSADDLVVHNQEDTTLALILANMTYHEDLPRPMGILQQLKKESHDQRLQSLLADAGFESNSDLQQLLIGESSWQVS